MTKKDEEIYYYAGQRINGTKLVHTFVEQVDDTSYTYYPKARASKFAGAIVGLQYNLTEGLPQIWRHAEVGQAPDSVAKHWQVVSQAHKAQHQQKKIDPAPELTEAVNTIKEALMMQSRGQRAAFIAWLLNKL